VRRQGRRRADPGAPQSGSAIKSWQQSRRKSWRNFLTPQLKVFFDRPPVCITTCT
jgi:hypothetical protein